MASSSSLEGVTFNKGDIVSVEVEESSTNIISVKLLADGKRYRGILLQEDPSQYGVNPERVQGAPFWPPLSSSSGINLKTTPCSTERYSCKFEGQPSALTVFQPEVIKRSNRNQPAPQLSRILRPRRFVCRKCKKSYHVEEENGVEMSSAALSLQIERSTQDGVVTNSDSEIVQIPSPASSASKTLRTNRSRLALSEDSNPSAQSIRHVTPSIIPKLNDDYGLSGRESEADSNSDDAVVVRNKKSTTSEKPVLPHAEQLPPVAAAVKSTVPAKRKAEVDGKPNRPKKIKRTVHGVSSRQPSLSIEGSEKPCLAPESLATPVEPVSVPDNPKGPEATPPPDQKSHLPVSSAKVPPVPPKPEDPMVRKNRIKAQYVSVATPFRFPPSRSSKPNLFANNPFSAVTKDKSTVQKRVRASDPSSKKSKPVVPLVDSPGSPRKSNPSSSCPSTPDSLGSKKHTPSDNTGPLRSRTRTRSNVSLTPTANSDNKVSNPVESSSQAAETNTGSETETVVDRAVASNATATLETSSTDANCALSHTEAAAVSLAVSSQPTKVNLSGSSTTQSPNVSTSVSASSQCVISRSKSIDYEKPKNRWIREARARRTQEERTTGSTMVSASTGSVSIATTTCASDSTGSTSSTGMSSPTLSRLRVRSGEFGSTTTTTASPTANVSPKGSFNPKKRSNPLTVTIPDNPGTAFEEEQTKSSATAVTTQPTPSPRGTAPNSDGSTSTCLPVLKIKINRQRPPSSASSAQNAQYEVVEFQVSNADESHVIKSNAQDPFDPTGSNLLPDGSVDGNNECKINTPCNGSSTATGSPSPSGSSSRKGMCNMDPIGLGRLVKRCRLSDGVVFHVGDLVWSKLSGWPYWPAQITSIHQALTNDPDPETGCTQSASPQSGPKQVSYTACLHWFAWHQVSYMACDKLYHFMQHYKRFDNKKKRGVFRQAVNEARQAADEKQAVPSSPSDAESVEDEIPVTEEALTTVVAAAATTTTVTTVNSHTINSITTDVNQSNENEVPPSATFSIVQTNPITDTCQQEQSSVTSEPSSTISGIHTNLSLAEGDLSSPGRLPKTRETTTAMVTIDSSESSKPRPTSARQPRRGASRGGRSRSLRGRRGGAVGDRVRASPRNLPTFFSSPEQGAVKTPYDQFDEMDAVETQLPFRRQNAFSGRGRGARIRDNANGANLSVRVMTTLPSTIPTTEPTQSSGSLKIRLSTAHLRLPGVKKRQTTKPKVSKKRTKPSVPATKQSVPSIDLEPNACVPSTESMPNVQSSVPSQPDQSNTAVNSTNLAPAPFQPNYDDPSEAILSQFPHVFPDFRPCGILSDAVDIPTFSEDESEEEDAGRLIIDPEVMAAVNVSNTVPSTLNPHELPTHGTVLPRGKPETNMLDEALYSSSYFPAMHNSVNPTVRSDLMNPLFEHSSLTDPLRSRPPKATAFASMASLSSSSIPIATNPSNLLYNLPSHPDFSGSRPPVTSPISSVLPFPPVATNDLACASRSRALDLFDSTLQPRSTSASYFRPSSHTGVVVPVTTPNAAVPYVTSDYPTR